MKKVYIASSWKNQLAVELLTKEIRAIGAEVLSFIENAHGENKVHASAGEKEEPFEKWVWGERGEKSFKYDTGGAMNADLVVYVGPSGVDAWCEVGCAYAMGVPIIGFWAKSEQVGLMRRIPTMWCDDAAKLVEAINEFINPKPDERRFMPPADLLIEELRAEEEVV